jgi:hypothetical protein
MTHPFDKSNALMNTSLQFLRLSSLISPTESPCELSDIVITEQDVIDQFQILKQNKP